MIDSGDLPPKRIINQRILGADHPRSEEWDTYYRYVGPQQQPRPKAEKAAAAASAAGTAQSVGASAKAPFAKQPKEPDHPPLWQPSLRSVSHPVQPPPPGPKISISVHPVPKALDHALNPLGIDRHLVDKFRNIVLLAENRTEFHMVSYAGYSKLESTESSDRHLIQNLVSHGIPFEDVHFSRRLCGPEGKNSTNGRLMKK